MKRARIFEDGLATLASLNLPEFDRILDTALEQGHRHRINWTKVAIATTTWNEGFDGESQWTNPSALSYMLANRLVTADDAESLYAAVCHVLENASLDLADSERVGQYMDILHTMRGRARYRWSRVRIFTHVIGRFMVLWKETNERRYAPDAAGYQEAKAEFQNCLYKE